MVHELEWAIGRRQLLVRLIGVAEHYHAFSLEGQVRASAAEHAFQRRVGELVLQSMLFSRVTLGVIIGREVRCEKN